MSRKKILDDTFFTQFVLSHTSDNSTSPNIGGRIHGQSPTTNFGGNRPPVPPKSPPMEFWRVLVSLRSLAKIEDSSDRFSLRTLFLIRNRCLTTCVSSGGSSLVSMVSSGKYMSYVV